MIPLHYSAVLSKYASAGNSAPNYREDSQKSALADIENNRKDNTRYLKSIFSRASDVERHQTKLMDKVLPGKTDKETGNPLLKCAFADALSQAGIEKTAAQVGGMYLGFNDELRKIADAFGAINKGLQGFKSLAKPVAQVAKPMAAPAAGHLGDVNKSLGSFKSLAR